MSPFALHIWFGFKDCADMTAVYGHYDIVKLIPCVIKKEIPTGLSNTARLV